MFSLCLLFSTKKCSRHPFFTFQFRLRYVWPCYRLNMAWGCQHRSSKQLLAYSAYQPYCPSYECIYIPNKSYSFFSSEPCLYVYHFLPKSARQLKQYRPVSLRKPLFAELTFQSEGLLSPTACSLL